MTTYALDQQQCSDDPVPFYLILQAIQRGAHIFCWIGTFAVSDAFPSLLPQFSRGSETGRTEKLSMAIQTFKADDKLPDLAVS